MDNIEKIDYEFDTSFLIGYEAQERSYDIFYYNPKDLFIKENTIQASGYYLELLLDEKNYFNFKSNKIIAKLEDFQFVFLRQDPPFDMNYITSTYILDLLPSQQLLSMIQLQSEILLKNYLHLILKNSCRLLWLQKI